MLDALKIPKLIFISYVHYIVFIFYLYRLIMHELRLVNQIKNEFLKYKGPSCFTIYIEKYR